MQPDELANVLRGHIQANGNLELNPALLPDLAVILESLQSASLTITNAKVQVATGAVFEGPLPAQVRVDGQASLLGGQALPTTCFFATANPLQICVQAHLPPGWKITDSIPNLPPSMRPVTAKSTMLTLQSCLLNDIKCQQAYWLVTNYAQSTAQISVGLNLSVTIEAQALLASALPFIAANPALTLQGPVQLSSSSNSQASLTLSSQNLHKPLAIERISLSDVRIRVKTTTPQETAVEETRVEVGGTIAIGKPTPAHLEVWTSLYPGANTWYFLGAAEDSSLSIGNAIDTLVDLAGGDGSDFHLPGTLQTLGNIHLQAFSVGLSPAQKSIEHVSLTVGSDATWSLIPDSVTIGALSLNWFILFPLNKQLRHNSLNIVGTLTIGQGQKAIKFDIEAHNDNGFDIEGSLSPGQTLHITDVIEAALGVDANLPALDIDQLYLAASSSGDYLVSAVSPTVWQIPIGITTVNFGDLALTVTHSRASSPATLAEVSGRVSLAGSQFVANCTTQGNFNISGTLPNVDLKALLNDIIGDAISLPSSFPAIELENSSVSIQKFQQDYICEISTTVDHWGTILVEAAKRSGQWGIAAGIALPHGWKLSSITSLPVFDEFSFSSLALVVASFQDPTYIFPNNSVPAVSGVVEGVNFYADLALNGALLGAIAKVISEDTLSIKAAIAAQSQNTFLSASLSKTINVPPVNNLPLSGGAGASITLSLHPSPLSASIAGTLMVPVGDQEVSLIGAIIIAENALTFAIEADAPRGILVSPMGFQGVMLNEIGIALSIQFEPPSLVLALEGQFALKGQPPSADAFAFAFGSDGEEVHPQLLSCKFAEVDLPIIFESCVNSAITLPALLTGVKFTDLLVYWCAIPSTLPDGSTSMPGYGFNALMDFFGWQAHASLMIAFNTGITGQAQMDPINLGNGVLVISGKAKNGGPALSVSTIASPYFAVTLDVSLLGLAGLDVQGQIANSGMHFFLNAHAYTFLDASVACTLTDPTHFFFSSSLKVNVNLNLGPLMLPGSTVSLGSVNVNGGFNGSITLNLNGAQFAATITGGIAWQGRVWSIPMLQLNVAPADMSGFVQSLFAYIGTMASQIFHDLIADADKWAKNVSSGVVTGVTDIATGLKVAYNQTSAQAAAILKGIGQDATTVGYALQSVYHASLNETAQALASAAYTVDAASNALKNAYGATSSQTTAALKSAGYTADQVASALKTVYGLTSDQVAQTLKGAGYAANQVASALKTVYGLTSDQAAQTLKGAGYAADQVANALQSTYGLTADQVAKALKSAGYTADQIASVLKNTFNWSADQVAGFYKNTFGLSGDAVNTALQNAGYATDQIQSAMHNAFDWFKDKFNPSNW